MIRRGLLAVFLLLALVGFARAQVQVTAQVQRNIFLLYERVDLIVTLTNIGNTDLELNNDDGKSWLSFEVSSEGMQNVFLPVHSERSSTFAPLKLKMGETKTLRVNITPLFAFRDEGNYRASAVVYLPGEGDISSEPAAFSILRGHTLVSRERVVDTLERSYSLIRFSPSPDMTDLYLCVESPSENLVYANIGLGELVSAVDPTMDFDPKGDVHILQPSGASRYLYTRTDAEGRVVDQRLFKSVAWQPRPTLAKLEDGSVIVQGGLEDTDAQRERLSDSQHGEKIMTTVQPKAAIPLPEPSSVPTRAEVVPPAPEPDATPAGDPGMTGRPAPAGP